MVSKLLRGLNKTPLGAKFNNIFKHDLIKKIRKAFIYQVLGAAAAFLSNVILARYLGTSTYGVYNFSVNLLRLLMIPALLGFGTFSVRFYPRAINEKNWPLVKGYKRFINLSTIAMSAVIILIGYILIYYTSLVEAANKDSYMIYILALPFFSFSTLLASTAQAMHKLSLSLMSLYILMPVLLPLFNTGYYYLISADITSTIFAWIFLLTTVIMMLYLIIGLRRARIKEVVEAKPKYAIKEWLTTSIPMLFTSSLQTILKQADVFMIGLLMTSREVGLYSAALKIDNIVLFGLSAVNFVEAPMFSKLYGQGDMKGLQKTVRSSAWLIFIFTVVISIPVVVFGYPILGLFGEEFKAAFWPLIFILIGNAINALSGSVGLLMSMTNHQKEAFYITAVSAVICVVLNYFLIQSYGIIGASIAIAISVIIRNVTMVIYVKKLLGINSTVLPF